MKVPANLAPISLESTLRLLLTLAVSILTLRFGVGIAAWRAANNLETPNYTIIKKLPLSTRGRNVELRKYDPYLIAETIVHDATSIKKASGKGFGLCAKYIFGDNQRRDKNLMKGQSSSSSSNEKMAMTAPVRSVGDLTTGAGGEKMAMTSPVRSSSSNSSSGSFFHRPQKTNVSFVIGSKYNLQTVPRPNDNSIRIRKVPEHYLAATTFAGPPPSNERISSERNAILETLANEGIRITKRNKDETHVYGYHDPVVTPNFLRRNEVCVTIDGSSIQ